MKDKECKEVLGQSSCVLVRPVPSSFLRIETVLFLLAKALCLPGFAAGLCMSFVFLGTLKGNVLYIHVIVCCRFFGTNEMLLALFLTKSQVLEAVLVKWLLLVTEVKWSVIWAI